MQKNLNIIFLLFITTINGCGLFDTRDVEPPTQPRSQFIQPTSPDIVLTNLISSIVEKDLDNYMRCFVDSVYSVKRFNFIPDALSQSSYPVFLNWNLNSERIYYSNLLSSTALSNASILFLDNLTFNNAIDSAIVDSDYTLVFNHTSTNVAKEVKGKLRFVMGTDTRSLWSIHTWYDFIDANNDTTWSVLKANFYN